MTRGLTTTSIRWAIGRFSEDMRNYAAELNARDGMLGDGDLGVTLQNAADRLAVEARSLPADVGMALLKCARSLTDVSGSTFGTLLATGLMATAKLTKGREIVPWSEMASLLAIAEKSMSDRGKGNLGDKTLLDAVEAARHAVEGLDDPAELVRVSVNAIGNAIDQLRSQPFRQGRARMFGAKGIGLDDPGMVAFLRIAESLRPRQPS